MTEHSIETPSHDPAPGRWRRRMAVGATCAICTFGALGFACQGKPKNPVPDPHHDAANDSGEDTGAADVDRLELDVIVFGRQLGAIAPCGCTTEPLGGLQFAFGHIEHEADPEARLVLMPGSMLFPMPGDPEAPTDEAGWAQAEQRAEVLHERFSKLGDDLVVGLGPADVLSPAGDAALSKFELPRVLTNVAPDAKLPAGVAPRREVELGGGRKAVVWMVLDPSLVPERAPGLPALTEPVAALEAATEGADPGHLNVAIVEGPRELAEQIAREVAGLDLVVMGGPLEGADRSRLGTPAAKLGNTWIVEPGDRGQTLAHLSLRFGEDMEVVPSVKDWANVPPRDQLRQELGRVEARLAKFAKDPNADPTFLANLRQQRDALSDKLEGKADESGTVAVFDQVKVTCKLPPDDAAKSALDGYDAWVAKANQARFSGVKTPEPPKGRPTYVGDESCGDCHEQAKTYWDQTRHAHAYRTLVDANKQFDLSCVGCHVTGFREPGGAEVVETRGLVNVQCEQCHGPGSQHADDPDTDNIQREAPVTVCLGCHTAEHSDTFEYEAYLRDVLGEGHGADARKALGNGPTGRELRAAGFEKAGGSCKKM